MSATQTSESELKNVVTEKNGSSTSFLDFIFYITLNHDSSLREEAYKQLRALSEEGKPELVPVARNGLKN